MRGRQHPRGVDLPPGCNNTETLAFVNPDRSISCGPSRGHWGQPCPEAGSPRPRGPGPRLRGPTGEWRLAGGTPCGNGRAAGWFVHSGRLRAEFGKKPRLRLLEIASARRPRPAARWWRRWHPHRTSWSDRPYDPGTTPYAFTGGTIKEAIIDVPSDRTATSSWRLGDEEGVVNGLHLERVDAAAQICKTCPWHVLQTCRSSRRGQSMSGQTFCWVPWGMVRVSSRVALIRTRYTPSSR